LASLRRWQPGASVSGFTPSSASPPEFAAEYPHRSRRRWPLPNSQASMRPGSRYAIAADTESRREHRAAVARHARRAPCRRRPPSRPSNHRLIIIHACVWFRICVNVGSRPLPVFCNPLRFLVPAFVVLPFLLARNTETPVPEYRCVRRAVEPLFRAIWRLSCRLHVEHRTSREQIFFDMEWGVRRRSSLFLANHTQRVRSVSYMARRQPRCPLRARARCAGLPINRSTIWTNDLLLLMWDDLYGFLLFPY